jgi:hypothetical protein
MSEQCPLKKVFLALIVLVNAAIRIGRNGRLDVTCVHPSGRTFEITVRPVQTQTPEIVEPVSIPFSLN